MKIMVTGGAGFIGSHLCEKLLNEGHQVVALDNLTLGRRELLKACEQSSSFRFVERDLLDLESVKPEFVGIDLVFHLAANSDISEGTKSTDRDLKMGTIATYNVCEAMRLAQVRQIIFASTSAIYGEATVRPTPEEYGPLLPISFYGASKLACEGLLTAFSHNYDFKVWIYRFANIVGSHSTHGAIYDFVQRLKKDSSQLSVLGNGTQKKSYLHVQDCIAGMQFGYANSKQQLQVFNLASEGYTQVRDIAESVVKNFSKQTQTAPKIVFGTEDRGWKGDVPFTWLDGRRLEALGWKARWDSQQSVAKAVEEVVSELLN